VEMGAAVIGTGSAVADGAVAGASRVNGDVVGVGEAVAGADAVVMEGLAVGVKGDRAEDELTDCDGSVVGGNVGNVVVVGVGVGGGVEGEMGKGASAMGLYGRI